MAQGKAGEKFSTENGEDRKEQGGKQVWAGKFNSVGDQT